MRQPAGGGVVGSASSGQDAKISAEFTGLQAAKRVLKEGRIGVVRFLDMFCQGNTLTTTDTITSSARRSLSGSNTSDDGGVRSQGHCASKMSTCQPYGSIMGHNAAAESESMYRVA